MRVVNLKFLPFCLIALGASSVVLTSLTTMTQAAPPSDCLKRAFARLQTLAKDPRYKTLTPVQIGDFKVPATYLREQH